MASRDYEEFIAALNAHGVRYLLIGAHAVAPEHHGDRHCLQAVGRREPEDIVSGDGE